MIQFRIAGYLSRTEDGQICIRWIFNGGSVFCRECGARLCRLMCGNAPRFRSTLKRAGGFAPYRA